MFTKEGIQQSEFNSGIALLNNINAGWIICYQSNFNMDLDSWTTALLNIYLDLTNYMSENERVEKLKEIKALKNRVNEHNTKRMSRKGFVDQELYWDIIEFHQWLKRIFGKSGLENRIVDDAAKALR